MLPFLRNAAWGCLAQLLFLVCGPRASYGACVGRPHGALSGRVRNTANAPMPGVVVALRGSVATTTNANGDFWLSGSADAMPVLVVAYAGYQTQALRIKAAGPLSITLYEVGAVAAPPAAGLETVVTPLEMADEQATFPGGAAAYRAYLQHNFRYPAEAKAQGLTGTVLVSFFVDEAGRILDSQITKSAGASLDEEALRLVRLMPWWTPAHQAGRPVRGATRLAIKFELQTIGQ